MAEAPFAQSGGPAAAAGNKNLQEALTVVSLANICFKKCVVPQPHKLSTQKGYLQSPTDPQLANTDD